MLLRYNIGGHGIFKVPANREGEKMARILVSMSDDFLDKVDGIATDEQRTRSELVREALRGYIKRSRTANPQRATDNARLLDSLLD